MNQINKQAQVEELAIELDENGMVVVNDPELLKLVSGAGTLSPTWMLAEAPPAGTEPPLPNAPVAGLSLPSDDCAAKSRCAR